MTLPGLALWLVLSGAPAAFTWDVPEVVEDVPVGTAPVAVGRPVKLRAVRSLWDAERLRRKLVQDFLRAGLFIPPAADLPQNLPLPYLAALDARRMISYSVLFQANRDGSTTLVLGEVALEARADARPPAPVFPGALEVLTTDVEAMRSVSYRVKATPAEVLGFYREVLGRAGYRDAGGGVHERGPEHVQVLARPAGESGLVRVVVLVGGPRPAGPTPPAPAGQDGRGPPSR